MYDWEGKEEECRRLYVEEGLSMDDLVKHWEKKGFTPSKRAFQHQFKRWGFPRKKPPPREDDPLSVRIKELWARNVAQKDMLDTLKEEGFSINEKELLRRRLKFGLLLRQRRKKKELQGEEEDATSDEEDAIGEEDVADGQPLPRTRAATATHRSSNAVSVDPDEELRRQIRRQQLQIESDERWQARKRRRRTRGWAGLPPDPPGEPPRFPSETTLDESKAYLSLDNALYREVRDQFQSICEQEGVIKKTLAGPEKWGQLKYRLVRENAHLYNVFQQDVQSGQQLGTVCLDTTANFKALSLDVICTDVTKRIRTMGTFMKIADAKTILGLNPETARGARKLFTQILDERRVMAKTEIGPEGWEGVKHDWIQRSDALRGALAAGEADPNWEQKKRAVEVVATDALKRFRGDYYKKNPNHDRALVPAPRLGPGPAPQKRSAPTSTSNARGGNSSTGARNATRSSEDTAVPGIEDLGLPPPNSDFEIDPSLLLAAFQNTSQRQQSSFTQHDAFRPVSQPLPAPQRQAPPPQPPLPLPLPIYFRLNPQSRTLFPTKTMWLDILHDGTLDEVRTMAMREHPGTAVLGIEGVVHSGAAGARDICIKVDTQDEFSAYLRHVTGPRGASVGGKATFVVLLGLA